MAAVQSSMVRYLLALAMLVVAGVLSGVEAQAQAESCKVDFQDLVTHCTKYVQKDGPKTKPSAECCRVIKPVDIACACRVVTEDVEGIISMEKAIYVVRSCGIKVPSGLKCGSYTIPAAWA